MHTRFCYTVCPLLHHSTTKSGNANYNKICVFLFICIREPDFFRSTIFLVDRMHWHGHRSCCRGYNINTYKGRLDLKAINTQVNEQQNAGLARIKGQLSYMLPDNFVFHAALYLSFRNTSKAKLLNV